MVEHLNYENGMEDRIFTILKRDGICVLHNYYKQDILATFEKEYDTIMEKYENQKKGIDQRIFRVQDYSPFIKKYLFNDKIFNSLYKRYHPLIDSRKGTMINKVVYDPNKIKSSGNVSWHRDEHYKQFKVIMYLNDVEEGNGQFKWLSHSNIKDIGIPKPVRGRTIYNQEIIDNLIDNHDKCKIYDITGSKGTIIIADTSYIHCGSVILKGCRKAITQYFR